MNPRTLVIAGIAVAVFWILLIWTLAGRAVEPEDSGVQVRTVNTTSTTWGPSTTTSSLPVTTTTTTTTTIARARTAPTLRSASVGTPTPTGTVFDSAHKPPAGRYAGSVNGSPCGDTLPPCRTLWIESKGSPTAVNPTGCNGRGCFGAWQYDPITWNNYAGYDEANQAPLSVQNEKARLDWNMGAGCHHWAAC